MIVILKPGAQKARVESLMEQIRNQGVDIHYSQGATETILGLVGDTRHVDEDGCARAISLRMSVGFLNRTNWRIDASIPRIRMST